MREWIISLCISALIGLALVIVTGILVSLPIPLFVVATVSIYLAVTTNIIRHYLREQEEEGK